MNKNQKLLLKNGLRIIFLMGLFLFFRIVIPNYNWFLMSIMLLGILYLSEWFNIMIFIPLIKAINKLNTTQQEEKLLDVVIDNLSKKKK